MTNPTWICFHYVTNLYTYNNKPVTLHTCQTARVPLICTTVYSNAKVLQTAPQPFSKRAVCAQTLTNLEPTSYLHCSSPACFAVSSLLSLRVLTAAMMHKVNWNAAYAEVTFKHMCPAKAVVHVWRLDTSCSSSMHLFLKTHKNWKVTFHTPRWKQFSKVFLTFCLKSLSVTWI